MVTTAVNKLEAWLLGQRFRKKINRENDSDRGFKDSQIICVYDNFSLCGTCLVRVKKLLYNRLYIYFITDKLDSSVLQSTRKQRKQTVRFFCKTYSDVGMNQLRKGQEQSREDKHSRRLPYYGKMVQENKT